MSGAPLPAMIGQEAQEHQFRAAMTSGRLHHAWLLGGPRGVGKAGFALNAALWMLSDAAPDLAAQIPALIAAGTHPDFRILSRLARDDANVAEGEGDLKRNISIAQVREIQAMLTTKPALSPRRVVMIDAIDDMERAAANALLKSLEEPPSGTIFLLISHAPDRLLPTIRSRCRTINFAPLDHDVMQSVIRAQRPDIGAEELALLVRVGKGSPGAALAYAGLEMEDMERHLHAILAHGDPDFGVRSELARTLALKNAGGRYDAFLRRVPALISEIARHQPARDLDRFVDAWRQAGDIAARAAILNHDKQAVVLEMSRLLASLEPHKSAAH